MSIIEVKKVSNQLNEKIILKDVSISIEEGKNIAIVGETGSGKSTLLKVMGGLLDVKKGTVLFESKPILGPKDKLIAGHDDIIYLSQHFELPRFISVIEHLDYEYKMGEDEAFEIFRACQIEHLLEKNTRQLSGGEKQRVALVKELLKSPKVLLIDEPFSNLDFIHKQVIKETLEELKKLDDLTIIMVSHEPKDVLPWADSVFVMKDGNLVQSGTPRSIYEKPINEYVAGLFGKYNLLDPSNWDIKNNHILVDGRLLLRPEQISLTSDSKHLGRVKNIYYYGSYYEVILSIGAEVIIVDTFSIDFNVGDEVSMNIE